MIRFDLPPARATERPAGTDASDGPAGQDGLPLTHPARAQTQLLQQLELLGRSPLPSAERLKILEPLWQPIAFVQNECARRFAAKPLPLAAAEQSACDAGQTLWQMLGTNYLHCLQACVKGRADAETALIAQRALGASAAAVKEAYRAGALPEAAHWRRLHQIYRTAEELGVTRQAIGHGKTVAETYIEMLLIAAAHPFELSPKQFSLVTAWAQRGAGKVAILAAAPAESRTRPLIVDLAGDQPAAFRPNPGPGAGPGWRWLDLGDLRKSLKKRLIGLARGDSPESLQLGKECLQPACEGLLKQVYRFWCKGDAGEGQAAGVASGAACHLVGGIEAIHYFLSGHMFRQPGSQIQLSKHEHEEIATFGRIATRHSDDFSQQHAIEAWQTLEEDATGLHLARALARPGMRLSSGQLVAVRPDGAKGFMLGAVRWVASGQGQLNAGVRLLPGKPVPVALRGTGITALNERFCPGFRLPAVEQLREPASVVMPKGYFRPDRVIEIYSDHSRQIRLKHLLEHGANFESADFEWT